MLPPGPGKSIVLLLADAYPPFSDGPGARAAAARAAALREAGREVEIVAPSPDGEEFIHLGEGGALVHRVSPARSYLARPLASRQPLGVRLAEKAIELSHLWRREIRWIEAWLPPRDLLPLRAVPALRRKLAGAGAVAAVEREHRRPVPTRIRSADIVLCTYNRLDDLARALPTVLAAAARAREAGVDCATTVVYQNEWLPERLRRASAALLEDPQLRLVFSSPPSLTRARNTGLAQTSRELVLFVDDDVLADPGLVVAHVEAANRFPAAVGVAGRVLSRLERRRQTRRRAVGQIRASGCVESNFDSLEDLPRLVPQTPMGVNMSLRRREVSAQVGPRWFDETLTGTAFREESTLAIELFRRGGHFVYAPEAVLEHLEAVAGGCANRWIGPLEKRAEQAGLDYLFLHRLHEGSAALRALASLARARRDLRDSPRLRTFVAKAYINLRGYGLGRRQWSRSPRP